MVGLINNLPPTIVSFLDSNNALIERLIDRGSIRKKKFDSDIGRVVKS
jgi:hypothetical protein